MLAVGQTVVYGTQGVCTVKEISMLKLGKTKGEYYVLSPIDDPGSTVYVPTASEKLANKLRPVLTGSEALKDQKKHFHNVDAQYLKTAERMLHGELAYALGIAAADVAEYIRRRMAGCDT
mgnify:CR=1 FL=1